MCRSNFSDAKGNCSKEIDDHGDAQNHGLVNNKILDQQRQSNHSVDGANRFPLGSSPTNAVPSPSIGNQLQTSAEPANGANAFPLGTSAANGVPSPSIRNQLQTSAEPENGANTFPLGTSPTNSVPSPSIENQLQTSAEPESAVINVESQSLMIFQTTVLPKRKRMADVKDAAKYTQEIHGGCKRLKNANTSSADGHVSLKDRRDSMEKSLKRQKKILVYLKNKGNELTDEVTDLSMHVLQTESIRGENGIQLQERIAQLAARNAQLEASIAQLEASIAQLEASIARKVNGENDSELDQAKN